MFRNAPCPEEQPAPLPEVLAGRCVHSLFEQASCRTCVEVCPRGAWSITDAAVGIDPDACDGCGLCATACPEGALRSDPVPAVYRDDGGLVAYAACSATRGDASRDGVIPCLHQLGVRELLDLYRGGVGRLVLAAGDCSRCLRGRVVPVQRHLETLNGLLTDRTRPAIGALILDRPRWGRLLAAARAGHRSAAAGRRAFFRRAMDAIAERAEADSDEELSAFTPPGRRLPRNDRSRLALYAPRIDPAACTGCNACAFLCPHEAIRLVNAGPESDCYRVDPDGCTGCGLCVDVCESGAVRIETYAVAEEISLPLAGARCRACGVRFHRPTGGAPVGDLCPVCRRTHHYRNLYQVLD